MIKKNNPPLKGASLKKTPIKSPSMNKVVVVDATQNKKNQKAAASARKEEKMSKLRSAGMMAGAALGTGAAWAYSAYHKGLRSDYREATKYAPGGPKGPYGDDPTNKELRKWNKSRKK